MVNPKIPLLKPHFDGEEIREIQKVLESGWVSQGPKTEELEKLICEYLHVNHAIAVNNCTAALHVSLLSMGITAHDEVLVADYTFPATGHAVLYCGGRPVFVDVDARTYNINPAELEGKISEKTKAIIPVHTFGQAADMDTIMEVAEQYSIPVIEDAACALGATYKKKYAGTMGDIGCFSFHARKGITTGEGGMVVTRNEELAQKIRRLSVFGMTSAWEREKKAFSIPEFVEVGYNYKMSDINAAVGVAQQRKLDTIIKRKGVLAQYWDEILEDICDIEPPYVEKNVTHVYQSYVPLVDRKIRRNHLIRALLKRGVQANIGTYASHIQPVYKSEDRCPVSLDIFRRALALPLYYSLKESEIDAAASSLKAALEESK